jgi:hypothetical protein
MIYDAAYKQGPLYLGEYYKPAITGIGLMKMWAGDESMSRLDRYIAGFRHNPCPERRMFELPYPPFCGWALREAETLLVNLIKFIVSTMEGDAGYYPERLRILAMFHSDVGVRMCAAGYLLLCYEFDCLLPQGPYFATMEYSFDWHRPYGDERSFARTWGELWRPRPS